MTSWLAFANDEKTFDIIKCFQNHNECHWRKYSFSKGDIVYFYVKSVKKVLYKTVVIEDKVIANKWEDDKYWIDSYENKEKDNRVLLRLIEEKWCKELSLNNLYDNGLKTTSSLTRPNKNPISLINYIGSNFHDNIDIFAGEIDIQEDCPEGSRKKVYVNRYERDPEERRKCIERYGNKYECIVCGFNFEDKYGEIGRGFIHVHHINPLADNGKDISDNLIPVCPNCHAMLHRYLKEDTRDYHDVIKEIKDLERKKKDKDLLKK